jgi:hypothetical protein
MYDDNRIVILRRDRLDQRIAIQPSREILPVKHVNVDNQQGARGVIAYLSPALPSTVM